MPETNINTETLMINEDLEITSPDPDGDFYIFEAETEGFYINRESAKELAIFIINHL